MRLISVANVYWSRQQQILWQLSILCMLLTSVGVTLASTPTSNTNTEPMGLKKVSESAQMLFLPMLLSNSGSLEPIPEIEIFERDFTQWSNLAESQVGTIDFESITAPSPVEVFGNEFEGLYLSPNFVLVDGGNMFVGNPSTGQTLTPTSGENMFFPTCNPACEGIIRITFDQNIRAFGAFFIDVEADFATTGFSTNIGSSSPGIAFSSSQGQNSQSFLGFISNTPFDSVDIHFATGANIDGTLIDDATYFTTTTIKR